MFCFSQAAPTGRYSYVTLPFPRTVGQPPLYLHGEQWLQQNDCQSHCSCAMGAGQETALKLPRGSEQDGMSFICFSFKCSCAMRKPVSSLYPNQPKIIKPALETEVTITTVLTTDATTRAPLSSH
eukprot:1137578-Pelagomonas_calceolata.AAC.5